MQIFTSTETFFALLDIDYTLFFGLATAIPATVTLLLLFVSNSKRLRWIRISTKLTKKNIFLFLFSIWVIIFFSFLLINWYKISQHLPLISRYIIGIILFAGVSVLFSILHFIIHVSDSGAYVINKDIMEYIVKKENRKSRIDKEVELLNKEIGILQEFSETLADQSSFRFLDPGSNELLNVGKSLSPAFKKRHKITAIQIDNSPYMVYTVTYLTGKGKPFAYNNRLLYKGLTINLSLDENDFDSFINASGTSISLLRHKAEKRIEFINDVLFPAKKEYADLHLPINIFIQSFLLDLFGMKVNYITPLSFWARMLFLAFAVYKFLLFGTFISMLIK